MASPLTVAMQFRVVGVILAVVFSVKGGKDPCELSSQWGGNACSLQGTLEVLSSPAGLPVTSDKCDVFYRKDEFKNQPTVKFPDAKSGEKYAVVMVDPDAPSHPEGKYWLHWVQANIPGEDLKTGDLKNGKVISQYRGPTPPDGTGTHRYMILVYRQRKDSTVSKVLGDNQRRLFDLGAWAASHGGGLCGPLSGVQFRTNFSGKPEK